MLEEITSLGFEDRQVSQTVKYIVRKCTHKTKQKIVRSDMKKRISKVPTAPYQVSLYMFKGNCLAFLM